MHFYDLNDDIKFAIGTSRGVLKLISVWPLEENRRKFRRMIFSLQHLLIYALLAFPLLPGFLHLFLREKNRQRQLKMMGPLSNCIIAVFKYTLLLQQQSNIKKCVDLMISDWNRTDSKDIRDIMMRNAKIGRRMVIISMMLMYGGGLSFRSIVPLVKGKIVTPTNVTIRPLVIPAYFVIFSEQDTPFYEIIFTLYFLSGAAVYTVTCGICGLAAMFMMHACGQFNLLREMMGNLVDGRQSSNGSFDSRLVNVVEYDLKTRSFLNQIEEILRYTCLLEIFGCAFLMCFALYYAIMEWSIGDPTALLSYMTIALSFIFSIFIFCYIGELLTEESKRVGATSCAIDWYRLPAVKARNLMLIISISNEPVRISAGKMIEMSLSSFSNIMRSALGYFNILRQVVT